MPTYSKAAKVFKSGDTVWFRMTVDSPWRAGVVRRASDGKVEVTRGKDVYIVRLGNVAWRLP